ncbi:MAG: gluconate 2-dehydrogenase subunit 3 family protein [Pseudohongiellaceae bacterium]
MRPNSPPDSPARRAFLRGMADAAKGSALVLTLPAILTACDQANEARRIDAPFINLTADEVTELRAIAARIMPTDDTPGAEEAGVIYFMDKVLTDPEQLATLQDGLANLQRQARRRHGGEAFHLLNETQQDELLRDIETGTFFRTLRFLTMAGMFCLPEYGGNRELAGYQMLAFEARHAWTPPFGNFEGQQADQQGGNR